MKKLLMSIITSAIFYGSAFSQAPTNESKLQQAVTQLDAAKTVGDYEALEKEFMSLSQAPTADWIPYYYAAFCNAAIGFLYQDDGEKVEPYSDRGEGQIRQALSRLDTTRHPGELSEIYTVASMIYRTKVFINPMTYGRKYGPVSQQYLDKAKQLNPENPRALYLEAWVKYNTPKMWGGDKKLAKELAAKSLALLAKEPAGNNPHWGKAENQALLGTGK